MLKTKVSTSTTTLTSGATIKEVWATDNNLAFDITVEDKLLQGLKVGLNSKFNVCNGLDAV